MLLSIKKGRHGSGPNGVKRMLIESEMGLRMMSAIYTDDLLPLSFCMDHSRFPLNPKF
jgi:hypothetical protein